MAPRTQVGFASLADTTNQPLQRPDIVRDMQMYSTSQLPINLTVGTSTDCSDVFVGNFDRVVFVMREAVSIQRLNELFATTGQVGFIAHVRADVIVTQPVRFGRHFWRPTLMGAWPAFWRIASILSLNLRPKLEADLAKRNGIGKGLGFMMRLR
jgi:Phage capsid family